MQVADPPRGGRCAPPRPRASPAAARPDLTGRNGGAVHRAELRTKQRLGILRLRSGGQASEPFDGVLIREDGLVGYEATPGERRVAMHAAREDLGMPHAQSR
jgi:hypothetical protein